MVAKEVHAVKVVVCRIALRRGLVEVKRGNRSARNERLKLRIVGSTKQEAMEAKTR
jgi:hypothetical protein